MRPQDISLRSEAERQAEAATLLPAFDGINLLGIKRKIAEMLALIGQAGIFEQYTKHDISHIDEMLLITEWLIPEETKNIMSGADWLLLVLSIYLHDLGMLVTQAEFQRRSTTGFPVFVSSRLFSGEGGKDYKSKLQGLSEEEQEKFLYQEFVRVNHAHRIRQWIEGKASEYLGSASEIFVEVEDLLRSLPDLFRQDLALVCESHHLDDLGETSKYRLDKAYRNTAKETANLQYCAILLRTADLLHITSDRTPSVQFRLISPTDPISQEEWAKQLAVTRVKPRSERNSEGVIDDNVARYAVEVHAHFKNVQGFFGLTTYLTYVESELKKSNQWAERSRRDGSQYVFPWKTIDESHIETQGFLRQSFEFSIDQARILDLLTGHTLYNESSIVLRELVQNALDAVRLQCYIDKVPSEKYGRVEIAWDEQSRTLTVSDNGTGMTQEIIEKHLLKVGSSRYQDSEFTKEFPDYSSISRFGIGILSTFMISDEVEIVTVHASEAQARHLSLRSVHGRYLVRLLDKDSEELPELNRPHGTTVKLRLRPSASLNNVTSILRKWVVIPKCHVSCQEEAVVTIGYKNLKLMLEQAVGLLDRRLCVDLNNPQPNDVKIIEKSLGETNIAYAVEWDDIFLVWRFLYINIEDMDFGDDEKVSMLRDLGGTCVEGIRVQSLSPGFSNWELLSLADICGKEAPKTNVARTSIEQSAAWDRSLSNFYNAYCAHIESQVNSLVTAGYSRTAACAEGRYSLNNLFMHSEHLVSTTLFQVEAFNLPLISIEDKGLRRFVSGADILSYDQLYFVEGPLIRTLESLLIDAKSEMSLSNVADFFHFKVTMANGPTLTSYIYKERLFESLLGMKNIGKVVVSASEQQIIIELLKSESSKKWASLLDLLGYSSIHLRSRHRSPYSISTMYVALEPGLAEMPKRFELIRALGRLFIPYECKLRKPIVNLCDTVKPLSNEVKRAAEAVLATMSSRISRGVESGDYENLVKELDDVAGPSSQLFDLEGLAKVVCDMSAHPIYFPLSRSRYGDWDDMNSENY